MITRSTPPLQRALEPGRRVCLFGVGIVLAECYDQIVLALGREPDVLCDNAPEKWNQVFFGRRCLSPAELAEGADTTTVIITARQHERIREQLQGLGLREVIVARFDRAQHILRGVYAAGEEGFVPEPPIDLHGKWTLVTGASRGIGRQIAKAMARLGSHLILHGRRISNLEGIVRDCASLGVEAVPLAAELADSEELERFLGELTGRSPQVDIVFNNAAIHVPGPWPDDIWAVPHRTYRECFAVNATAPIQICRQVIPGMIQRGFGRIVHLQTSLRYEPGEMPYVASKAALGAFVRDMSPHLEGTGVTMTQADPGWVQTEAGGPDAPLPVESVLPGVLLGALLGTRFNGRSFNAQDYAGLSLEAAIHRAQLRMHHQPSLWI